MIQATAQSSPGEIIAALRDVTMTFDGYLTRALAHVDLEIRRGEIFGLLGAKGAGKSTALKILAGRLRPTEGKVKVFGRSPRGGATKARIGYLADKADSTRPRGFFSRIFPGKNESSEIARGGSRFTQAILGNRDLIILDEPFGDIEPAEISEIKTLIRELAARGKTIILSSNSLTDAKDVGHRLAILHDGKIQGIGTLAELLATTVAIRVLAPVLPRETAEHVLKMLRAEIGQGTPSAGTAASDTVQEKPVAATSDQHLNPLTKKPEESRPTESTAKMDDAINHERLEALTKPAPPKK
jgi:ABC-type multidrug transport system ATPase subunit